MNKQKILGVFGIWVSLGGMWLMGYLAGKWSTNETNKLLERNNLR